MEPTTDVFARARATAAEIEAADLSTDAATETYRIAFLGAKGQVKALMAGMRDLAPEERKAYGQVFNEITQRGVRWNC